MCGVGLLTNCNPCYRVSFLATKKKCHSFVGMIRKQSALRQIGALRAGEVHLELLLGAAAEAPIPTNIFREWELNCTNTLYVQYISDIID